jgi:hypothetical protein
MPSIPKLPTVADFILKEFRRQEPAIDDVTSGAGTGSVLKDTGLSHVLPSWAGREAKTPIPLGSLQQLLQGVWLNPQPRVRAPSKKNLGLGIPLPPTTQTGGGRR